MGTPVEDAPAGGSGTLGLNLQVVRPRQLQTSRTFPRHLNSEVRKDYVSIFPYGMRLRTSEDPVSLRGRVIVTLLCGDGLLVVELQRPVA